MSRVAKKPVLLPAGVTVEVADSLVTIKGSKGTLQMRLHPALRLEQSKASIQVIRGPNFKELAAMFGTTRALIQNMVTGVSAGFERKLILVGVGYRAQSQGNVLNLNLGFSHPVQYRIPDGVFVKTPTQTEIVLSSASKEQLGQVAAEIRAFRPPEPYKGKGVRYADEVIRTKEGKKK